MLTRPDAEVQVRRKEEIFHCSRLSSDEASSIFHTCITEACCDSEFDSQLCWPKTLPNTTVKRPCEHTTEFAYPDESDAIGKFAYRTCLDGLWQLSDYSECIDAVQSDEQRKQVLAQIMLWIYVVVGAISLISLLIAYYVFLRYRALQCNRITVHRHFVLSFIIRHILLLLILHPNFYLLFSDDSPDKAKRQALDELDKTLYVVRIPSISELLYIIKNHTERIEDSSIDSETFSEELPANVTEEKQSDFVYLDKLLDLADTYSFLCIVAWMFIEGFYLYYRTIAVFKSEAPFRVFYVIGWGVPAAITVLWIILVEVFENGPRWTFETKAKFRWIIAGPFLAVITVNIIFLIQIIFILARKLRSTRAMEMSQTKKAIRGILLILPLLGITNVLFLVDPTDEKVQAVVILYRVANTFLQSSQGFAVAVIYCFTNQEVQAAVKKRWFRYMQTQSVRSRRRSTLPAVATLHVSTHECALRKTPHRNGFVVPVSRSDQFAVEELRELNCHRASYRSASRTNSYANGSINQVCTQSYGRYDSTYRPDAATA